MKSKRSFVAYIAVSLIAAAGCGGDAEEKKPPPLPVAACDMQPYEPRPRSEVGRLVAYEEIKVLDLRPEAVDALLEQVNYTALSPVPYGCRVFRFRYTTQDRGKLVEATAALGIPSNAELPEGELPVAAFLHGTTGFADPCAPSRSLDGQAGAALPAALGFVGVSPDYIGLMSFGEGSTVTHGYLVGEQVAIGSLDAVRAGIELVEKLDAGVRPGRKVVPWGASQGGHATLFTDLYAPYYAPELDVPAAVSAVPPSVLLPLAKMGVENYSPPTMAFAAVLATMRRWYGAPADMTGVLTDEPPFNFASTIEEQLFVEEECNTAEAYREIDSNPELQHPDLIYKADFIDAVLSGRKEEFQPFACCLEENSLATSSVKPLRFTPTLMVYSENDDLVVTAPMRDDFDRLCGLGFTLSYLECKGANHVEGAVWSLPQQVAWIRDRLDGKPLPDDMCRRKAPEECR